MIRMRRPSAAGQRHLSWLSGLLLLLTFQNAMAGYQLDGPDPTEIIPLWTPAPPGGANVTVVEHIDERAKSGAVRDRALVDVTRPRMAVFRPEKPNGAAVVLFPGGGYVYTVIDKEAYESARWFAKQGYTAFVLFYRQPDDGWTAGPDTPLQDAQRGVRLVRAKAAEYGLHKDRIAILGFSAGGHVAASLETRFDAPVYTPTDAADQLSARPDAVGLLYPVIKMGGPDAHHGSAVRMLGEHPTPEQIRLYSPDQQITPQTPPTFLVHAADDPAVPISNSMSMFTALRAAGVPAELHIFEHGSHGFGLRGTQGLSVAVWPSLFLNFLRGHGFP